MKVIWERTPSPHTRYGFYLEDDSVLFEYDGPFDSDGEEWVSSKGRFHAVDFRNGLATLDKLASCEITGPRGEVLTFVLHSNATMDVSMHGREYGNNISLFGVQLTPSELLVPGAIS